MKKSECIIFGLVCIDVYSVCFSFLGGTRNKYHVYKSQLSLCESLRYTVGSNAGLECRVRISKAKRSPKTKCDVMKHVPERVNCWWTANVSDDVG